MTVLFSFQPVNPLQILAIPRRHGELFNHSSSLHSKAIIRRAAWFVKWNEAGSHFQRSSGSLGGIGCGSGAASRAASLPNQFDGSVSPRELSGPPPTGFSGRHAFSRSRGSSRFSIGQPPPGKRAPGLLDTRQEPSGPARPFHASGLLPLMRPIARHTQESNDAPRLLAFLDQWRFQGLVHPGPRLTRLSCRRRARCLRVEMVTQLYRAYIAARFVGADTEVELRERLVVHFCLEESAIVSGARFAPRMQETRLLLPACLCKHSQQMPWFAHVVFVQGHICVLIS